MIQIKQANLSIDKKPILQDINLDIRDGECVALLGPNGAGKSSLIDLITGMLAPDSGSVSLWGQPFARVRHRVGVQFEYTPMFDYLALQEVLQYFCAIYGVSMAETEPLLNYLGLGPIRHKRGYVLSKGERKKIGLLLALIGRPELLILDEPTSDLDPFVREQCWRLFKDKGRTVFFSTHLWEEAERYADRIVFIAGGRIRQVDTPQAFLSEKYLPAQRKVVVARDALKPASLEGAIFLEEEEFYYIFPSDVGRFLDRIKQQTANISILQKDLKDVYLYLTKNG